MGDVWLKQTTDQNRGQTRGDLWDLWGPTYFCPERAKASFFQHFPPAQELFEIVPLSPDVELNLKLAKRQREILILVGLDEGFERGVFCAFDIDLENVDESMACGRILNERNKKKGEDWTNRWRRRGIEWYAPLD